MIMAMKLRFVRGRKSNGLANDTQANIKMCNLENNLGRKFGAA
jgi:hypothetical protein